MDKGLEFNIEAALGTEVPLWSSWIRPHLFLLVTSVGVLLPLLFVFFDRVFAVHIKNDAGRPIKEITTDARVMKFVGR